MAKTKRIYQCQACQNQTLQWAGQCSACQAWNSFIEVTQQISKPIPQASAYREGYAGATTTASIVALNSILIEKPQSLSTGFKEFDRVLGTGLVDGAVVLLGGEPGIGKSTLLLQMLSGLQSSTSSLYVTGEESLQQIAIRAQRLGFSKNTQLKVLTETHLESIFFKLSEAQPKVLIIDSIQTIYTETVAGAPGSIVQLKECTAHLTRYAKTTDTTIFLTGHVNKEGTLAGPRILEHMVDTVLYFESSADQKLRLIRAVKNRFGPVNELGVFAMTDKGLQEITNPSAILLSRPLEIGSGSLVTATWEGNRPLLVELQALVDTTHFPHPKRVAIGLDPHRLSMLLAVLHRHGGIKTYDQDIFINVVGGIRLSETSGSDLPVLLAILSSLYNRPLSKELLAFGEIGLSGEIRPVTGGRERLNLAAKHGFKRVILPQANAPKQVISGISIVPVSSLSQVLEEI